MEWYNRKLHVLHQRHSRVTVTGLLPSLHTVPSSGLLIIGVKKTAAGIETPFSGIMTCLQLWNSRLSISDIITVFQANRCKTLFDPFFKWYDAKSGTQVGNVKGESPSSITKPDTGEKKKNIF